LQFLQGSWQDCFIQQFQLYNTWQSMRSVVACKCGIRRTRESPPRQQLVRIRKLRRSRRLLASSYFYMADYSWYRGTRVHCLVRLFCSIRS
jgi:hypothetical protein